ncbi:hypothetical protein BJV74DRAFT_259576 [Russula compacta]|nr:hypothetical protein BJV74DRAFT_259576 [Russula compacta]
MSRTTEMRAGLDLKRGFSKISHALMYCKYAKETYHIAKTASDRARNLASAHEIYDEQQEHVACIAEATYRSFFGFRDPFPNPDQESSWALSVWTMACAKTGTNIVPPPDLMERLASLGPRFRATVKDRITPLVERYYGFETSKAAESLSRNIERARALKTDGTFSYSDEEPPLPYRHRIIQQAINVIWFNDRSSDGVIFSSVFNPMPYEAIALVLAALECCIDEWSNGLWIGIPFTYENYQEVYSHHLSALKSLSSQGLDLRNCDPLQQLRCEIFNGGRDHAGVPRRSMNLRSSWPREKVDAACDRAQAV